MSNYVYPKALDAIGAAAIDLTSTSIRVLLVKSPAAYSANDVYLDALGANTVGTGQVLSTCTLTSGALSSTTTSVTFTAPTAGQSVNGYVLYVHTGTSSTSHLLAWVDRKADTTPIAFTTTGGDVTVGIPAPVMKI